jgi:hypothetical protein
MAGLASRFHMMPSFNVRPCTEARTIVPKPESGHARVALKVIEGGSAERWYQVDAAADCDFGCVFREPRGRSREMRRLAQRDVGPAVDLKEAAAAAHSRISASGGNETAVRHHWFVRLGPALESKGDLA